MIDFEMSSEIEGMRQLIHSMAESSMRPISREYDEREHEDPTEWHEMMWSVSRGSTVGFGGNKSDEKPSGKKSERFLASSVTIEELSVRQEDVQFNLPRSLVA